MGKKNFLWLIVCVWLLLNFSPHPLTAQEFTISLNKTVGTQDGVCGTQSSIAVDPGTAVYYCYTVTNNSSQTLGLHSLDDDKLGALLDEFVFDLLSGESVSILQGAIISEDTTNTATWTAAIEEGGPSASAQASATITVTIDQAVQGVPALSDFSIVLFAVLLLMLGVKTILMRRRKKE